MSAAARGREPLFRAEGLELRYGRAGRGRAGLASSAAGGRRQTAFAAERLEIGEGEVVALLGPNGSGKTSLLKALNGLIKPAAGRILFQGEDLHASRSLRRRSVYLHQAPYILAGSVSYNLYYGAGARGLGRSEAEAGVAEALSLLGLAGYERRGHRELSGGEAQRVALARALAAGADVLLLDEPTASADAASAALVLGALRARAAAGATIVFSSHDPALAAALATRTIVLEAGAVVADRRE
ncbi:MAG: energy-coupling factor ABC transporter ATP-binding protein [Spirochaetaceae bacterium]|nr:energy-coupling factor ABC transporter ATP-binding protein [Spirochaetaceae bacterium]